LLYIFIYLIILILMIPYVLITPGMAALQLKYDPSGGMSSNHHTPAGVTTVDQSTASVGAIVASMIFLWIVIMLVMADLRAWFYNSSQIVRRTDQMMGKVKLDIECLQETFPTYYGTSAVAQNSAIGILTKLPDRYMSIRQYDHYGKSSRGTKSKGDGRGGSTNQPVDMSIAGKGGLHRGSVASSMNPSMIVNDHHSSSNNHHVKYAPSNTFFNLDHHLNHNHHHNNHHPPSPFPQTQHAITAPVAQSSCSSAEAEERIGGVTQSLQDIELGRESYASASSSNKSPSIAPMMAAKEKHGNNASARFMPLIREDCEADEQHVMSDRNRHDDVGRDVGTAAGGVCTGGGDGGGGGRGRDKFNDNNKDDEDADEDDDDDENDEDEIDLQRHTLHSQKSTSSMFGGMGAFNRDRRSSSRVYSQG
jgi:hypothetical protein